MTEKNARGEVGRRRFRRSRLAALGLAAGALFWGLGACSTPPPGGLAAPSAAPAPAGDRQAATAAIKADISNLRNALQLYHSDWGAYPASGNAKLVASLKQTPKFLNAGAYMPFKAGQLRGGQFYDHFGHPYVYCLRGGDPAHANPDEGGYSYYLYSCGPDGKDDTAELLRGWEKAANPAERLQDEPGDDITSWY